MTFEERLDAMELEIRKPIFRKNRGRANEVNFIQQRGGAQKPFPFVLQRRIKR